MGEKRVLFVEPRGAFSNVYENFMDRPLLGPIYLATIARNLGHEARVFNENLGRDIQQEDYCSLWPTALFQVQLYMMNIKKKV